MRTLCVLLTLTVAVIASATDWGTLDEWIVYEDEYIFGLTSKGDGKIYLTSYSFDYDPVQVWRYSADGTFEGIELTVVGGGYSASGLCYINDGSVGGEMWLIGGLTSNIVYIVDSSGNDLGAFAAPATWDNIHGIAYNPDNDLLYLSYSPDVTLSGSVAWDTFTGPGFTPSWTESTSTDTFSGLSYGDVGGAKYLFAMRRDRVSYWDSMVYIWTLDGSGLPTDIYIPDDIIAFGDDYMPVPGNIYWDGDYLWVNNQNHSDPDVLEDAIAEIWLNGYSPGDTNITPASLGHIKAQFK
ncbi:MAG: hypothetical protein JSW52_10370 [Candidatus Coatesbacteria bacterium]|nr:MAG: hypothetical protein JSW52_10370 [Candidatus Coatesbacteria bacterium]